MKFSEALSALGVQTHQQVAAKLGVARQAVTRWAALDRLPAQRVYQIRDIVEGRASTVDTTESAA